MSDDNEPVYQLIADFQIDNNELEGLSVQDIFCMGVEFGYAIIYARQDAAFRQSMHQRNVKRMEALLWRYKRRYMIEHVVGDTRMTFHVEQKR